MAGSADTTWAQRGLWGREGGGRDCGTVPRRRAKGCTVGPVAPPISYVSHGLNCAIEKFAVTVLIGAGVKVLKRVGFCRAVLGVGLGAGWWWVGMVWEV